MRKLLLVLTGISLFLSGQCQEKDTANMIRYTPDFKFLDGIFLNFEQVRNNEPLLKSRILTTIDYNDEGFFERLLRENKVSFYDELGTKQDVPVSKIWGYARNGILYIKVGTEFNRITFIGRICHFIGNVSNYSSRYNDPYMNNYYNPYAYNSYIYGTPYNQVETKEMQQFLLDFATGKVMEFDVKSMEALLVTDPQLYDEFSALSGRKQKQLKFLYLRKFNEKHPLYFPDHSKTIIK